MVNRIIEKGLIALVLAGAIGTFCLLEKANAERREREYQEFSAIYNDIKAIQKMTGGEWAQDGQKLLDGLGINYRLEENERVKLDVSQRGAYVYVETFGSKFAVMRGFAEKSALDQYILTHKKSQ